MANRLGHIQQSGVRFPHLALERAQPGLDGIEVVERQLDRRLGARLLVHDVSDPLVESTHPLRNRNQLFPDTGNLFF